MCIFTPKIQKMIDYEKELNESQLRAVTYCEGPSLVIAGAGSGKTRVLTYKIAYLLEHGYKPWNILALTFTNKAAREMRERITSQVGDNSVGLWMGTFHSIFARILRAEAATLGFTSNYTIYDAADQKSLLKSIIKEMELDDKVYKPASVAAQISNAKNQLILPDRYAANPAYLEADASRKMPKLHEIYSRYWKRCHQADAMDFDDLLVHTAELFNYYPDALKRYADRFRYILVDEYQDTNYAQHYIIRQLTQQSQNVCVVGDDAQSIYSFRGARIDNILNFTKQFAGAQIFKLERNYRSTKTIVQAANSLIDKNKNQIHKEVFSENGEGERIPVIEAYSDLEESAIVAQRIRDLKRREQLNYSDIAILYRTNAQSRTFEETFRRENLPYRIYGGLSFYQRKEVKDIIAYFRLVLNPNDEEAFKRIINVPARGIGATTVGKIVDCANAQTVSLWNVLSNPELVGLNVNKGTLSKLYKFREMIAAWHELLDEQDAYVLGQQIVRESGLIAELFGDNTPEGMARQENVNELLTGLHDFVETVREEGGSDMGLRDFLAEVSLLSDLDTDDGDSEDKITLMTVHSAKGLEFDTVFVVGMERDLFPSQMSNTLSELEEERRLFYVAITRAKRHCVITHAKSRFRYGQTEMCNPSPFLKDLDYHYLDIQSSGVERPSMERSRVSINLVGNRGFSSVHRNSAEDGAPVFIRRSSTASSPVSSRTPVSSVRSSVPSSKSASSSPAQSGDLHAGSVIEHERFGIGDVLSVTGTGENTKAVVKFRHAGEKQLLLKFARFKIIS